MNDQETSRDYIDHLRENVWLNGFIILVLVAAGINNATHAWDGGSRLAAAWALLDIACIYLFSLNIARWWRKQKK